MNNACSRIAEKQGNSIESEVSIWHGGIKHPRGNERTRIPLVDLAHSENESQPTRDANPILRRFDARLRSLPCCRC